MADSTRSKEIQKVVEIAMAEEKGQRLILEQQMVDLHRLSLPPESQVHPVFHVSQLKKKVGPLVVVAATLPATDVNGNFQIYPYKLLSRRMIKRNNQPLVQWLIQWVNSSPEDATWEDYTLIQSRFPDFNPNSVPCGQGTSGGGGNVMTMRILEWERDKKLKKSTKKEDGKKKWLQKKLGLSVEEDEVSKVGFGVEKSYTNLDSSCLETVGSNTRGKMRTVGLGINGIRRVS